MSGQPRIPAQFQLLSVVDERTRLVHAVDNRDNRLLFLLRLCDSEQMTDAVRDFCQRRLKESYQWLAGQCTSSRIVASKQLGVFAVYDTYEGRALNVFADAQGGCTAAELVGILRDTAEALDHIHENNLAHGHVRPSTIWVNDSGLGALIDVRFRDDVAQELGHPVSKPPSIEDDRVGFATVLDVCLSRRRVSNSENERLPGRVLDLIKEGMQGRTAPVTRACIELLDEIEAAIRTEQRVNTKVRWRIVPEFADIDPYQTSMGSEFERDLPQIKAELEVPVATAEPAAAVAGQGERLDSNPAVKDRRLEPPRGTPPPLPTQKAEHAPASGASNTVRAQTKPPEAEKKKAAAPRTISPVSTLPSQTGPKSNDTGPADKPERAEPDRVARFAGRLFLFSMMVLALAVGYKFSPYRPQPKLAVSTSTSPATPGASSGDLDERKQQLEQSRSAAEAGKVPELVPKSWAKAEAAFNSAMDLYQAGQKSATLTAIEDAAKLYEIASQRAAAKSKFDDAERDLASFTTGEAGDLFRQNNPPQYAIFETTVEQSRKAVEVEDFPKAAEFATKAVEIRRLVDPQVRLDAAKSAATTDQKVKWLLPLLKQPNAPGEVAEILSTALKSAPDWWLNEAEERLTKLGTNERVVALCEVAQARHQFGQAQKAQKHLITASQAIPQLSATADDPQVVFAALLYLETLAALGSADGRSVLSEPVCEWCLKSIDDPIDASLLAGACLRCGNLAAWERLMQHYLGKFAKDRKTKVAKIVNDATDAEDAVAISLITATGNQLDGSVVQFAAEKGKSTPVAAAYAAMRAAGTNAKQLESLVQRAEQWLPLSDAKSPSAIRANEWFYAAKMALPGGIEGDVPVPASELTGWVATARCLAQSEAGDLQSALAAWEQVPQRFLLKSPATKRIVGSGLVGGWKPIDALKWSVARKNPLDTVVALAHIGVSLSGKDVGDSADKPVIATDLLKAGTVYEWREFAATGRTATAMDTGNLRLFVRSVEAGTLTGFVEASASKQLFFCVAKITGTNLRGQLFPVIMSPFPRSESRAEIALSLTKRLGTSIRTEVADGTLRPNIAAIDFTRNAKPISNDDSNRLEELEARLLVVNLANPRKPDGGLLQTVQWQKTPTRVFLGIAKEHYQKAYNSALQKIADRRITEHPIATVKQKVKALLDREGDDTHVIWLQFGKQADHVRNAEALRLPWLSTGPMGYSSVPEEPNVPTALKEVLLQLDPEIISDANLEAAIQHLWCSAIGFGIGHESGIETSFNSSYRSPEKPDSPMQIRPLTKLDRMAVRIFLEEVGAGMKPMDVAQRVFRSRDLWTFGPAQ